MGDPGVEGATPSLPEVPRWQDTPEVVATPPVRDAPTPLATPGQLALVTARAEQVVPLLARAVGWLRWPSLLLVVVASAAPLVLAVLALTWQGWPRIAGVVLALLAVVPVVLFARARSGTLRAAREPSALVAELTAFATHVSDGMGVLDKLAAVAQRGGVRLLSRLRAVWDVVQLPGEALEHLDSQPHLRWLTPPQIGETWGRLIVMAWTAFGCWCAVVVLAGLSATPVL